MNVIEVQSKTDEHGNLKIDFPLQVKDKNVRGLILFDEKEEKISDYDWIKSASASQAFDVLNEPEKDIYSPDDGEPSALKE